MARFHVSNSKAQSVDLHQHLNALSKKPPSLAFKPNCQINTSSNFHPQTSLTNAYLVSMEVVISISFRLLLLMQFKDAIIAIIAIFCYVGNKS